MVYLVQCTGSTWLAGSCCQCNGPAFSAMPAGTLARRRPSKSSSWQLAMVSQRSSWARMPSWPLQQHQRSSGAGTCMVGICSAAPAFVQQSRLVDTGGCMHTTKQHTLAGPDVRLCFEVCQALQHQRSAALASHHVAFCCSCRPEYNHGVMCTDVIVSWHQQ